MEGYRLLLTASILHLLTPIINANTEAKSGKPSPGCTHLVSNPGKSPVKKSSVCSDMNLKDVPRSMASGIVSELNINGNQITTLHETSFTTWTDIETLSADNNRIRMITEKAFKPLKKLRKLSLSNNQLVLNDGVNNNVFRYITQLESLDLSHNPLGTIPNNFFKHLKRLRILRLNNARDGVKVKEYSFTGLRRLETLDLTNNFLRKLPEKGVKNSLSNMSLMNLYLGGTNYWQCDCHLRWLKVWQVQHHRTKVNYKKKQTTTDDKGKVKTEDLEPICRGPPLVKDKALFGQEIQITDFQCKPEVRTKPYSFKMRPGVNVTLSCAIFSDPKGLVHWFKDGTLVGEHWKHTQVSQTQGADFRADLVILNLRATDAGEWVCEAKNRRGTASTNFTIEVVAPSKDGVLMTRVVLYGGIAAAGLIVFLIAVGIVIYCIYYRRDQAASRAYKTASQRGHGNHGGAGRRDLVGDAIDGLLDSDPEYHSSTGGVGGVHGGAAGAIGTTSDGHHHLHHHLLDKDGAETVPLTSRMPKSSTGSGGAASGVPPPPYPAATATIRRVTTTPGGPIVHNENCPVHGSRAMMAVAAAAAATYGPCPVHSSTTAVDGCIGTCVSSGGTSAGSVLSPQSSSSAGVGASTVSRAQTPQLISNPVYGTLPSAATAAAQLRAAAAVAAAATGGYKPCPLHGDMYATIQKQAAARTTPLSSQRSGTLPTRQTPPQQTHQAHASGSAASGSLLMTPTTSAASSSASSYVPAARVDDCITAATSFVGVDDDDDDDDEDSLPPPPPPLTATSELSDDDLASSTLRRNSKSATNASTSTGTASSSSSVMAAAAVPPLPPPPPPPPLPLSAAAITSSSSAAVVSTTAASSSSSSAGLSAVTSTTTTVTPSVSTKTHQDDEGYSTAV